MLLIVGVLAWRCTSGDETTPTATDTNDQPASQDSPTSTAATQDPSSPTTLAPATALTVESLTARLSNGRTNAGVGAVGNRIIIVGGSDDKLRATDTALAFDLDSTKTSSFAKLDATLYDPAVVTTLDSLVVIGGTRLKAASTGVTKFKNDGSVESTANLPSPRTAASAVFANNVIYLVGGYDGANPSNDVLASSDGGVQWKKVAALKQPTMFPAVFVQGTTLWVAGGEWQTKTIKATQQIDLATGEVTLPTPLTTSRSRACTVTLHGTNFMLGGRTPNGLSDEILVFNGGSVTSAGKLPIKVSDHDCVTVGDTGYLLAGSAPKPIRDIYLLTPS